ncbi:MAG: hypothetical protein KC652_19000 [Cyanobacteria bacterium HKST-UBA01]|nr:hypothetical protein [Cyanobacteria bacterium HKST-UBA01]
MDFSNTTAFENVSAPFDGTLQESGIREFRASLTPEDFRSLNQSDNASSIELADTLPDLELFDSSEANDSNDSIDISASPLHKRLLNQDIFPDGFQSLTEEERDLVDQTIRDGYGEERGDEFIRRAETPFVPDQDIWTATQLANSYQIARNTLSAVGLPVPQAEAGRVDQLAFNRLNPVERELVEGTIRSGLGQEQGQAALDRAYGPPESYDYSAQSLQHLYLGARERIARGIEPDAPLK